MNDPRDFDPPVGIPEKIAPAVRRILAPNPSPMTFRGTNTYVIGTGHVAVIDPGPLNEMHLQAILTATAGETIESIFVTHSHLDHSPLAPVLAAKTGAQTLGFGPASAGRSTVMQVLAEAGLAGGGEGVDHAFTPDRCLADATVVRGTGWEIEALWTPGHFCNHMSFAFDGALFTGDQIMGWATSLVSPPDGDLHAYMQTCQRLLLRGDRVFFPGHGAPIHDPKARLEWLIAHRMERESQILQALSMAPATARTLCAKIYTDVAPALMPAAERNVLAHLIDLKEKNLVSHHGPSRPEAVFRLL